MRRAPALLALACLLAAGCGGGGGNEEEAVRKVLRDYLTGIAAANGERACAQLTETAREEVVETVTAAFPGDGGLSCEEAVAELSADLAPGRKSALLNPVFREVSITGDKAEVAVKGLDGAAELTRVDGEWRVVRGGV